MSTKLTDDEIIDYIIGVMYSDNDYAYVTAFLITHRLNKLDIHPWDIQRIWLWLKTNKLIQKNNINDNDRDDPIYRLTFEGMEIIRKHGSYLKYIEHLKEPEVNKEKIEKNDRRIKNVGILATLSVSLLTLILTQCPKQKEQEQKRIEEGIQSVSKKLDSLLQGLPQSKPDTKTLPKGDTAIKK